MSVCCEYCVLSGRDLCDQLITRPEESYRLWCVLVYDLETSRMRRPWPALGRSAPKKKHKIFKENVGRIYCTRLLLGMSLVQIQVLNVGRIYCTRLLLGMSLVQIQVLNKFLWFSLIKLFFFGSSQMLRCQVKFHCTHLLSNTLHIIKENETLQCITLFLLTYLLHGAESFLRS